MRSSERRGSRGRRAALLALAPALVLAACTNPAKPSPVPSTPGATPRPFTVMSTDRVTVTDPAAATDQASTMFAINVFQRLMTSAPGQDVLKPDAARDCGFIEAPTIYTCTLQKDLTFAGGDPLTSSDVKFSIDRALRLDVSGSSTSLLSSLRRIETPDDVTVRFVLSREDTQFGWALASPAASIVDEQQYDADEVRSPEEPAVGSGPFVVTSESTALSKDLKRRGWTFVGPTTIYAFMQAMGLVNDHVEGCASRSVAEAARKSLNHERDRRPAGRGGVPPAGGSPADAHRRAERGPDGHGLVLP